MVCCLHTRNTGTENACVEVEFCARAASPDVVRRCYTGTLENEIRSGGCKRKWKGWHLWEYVPTKNNSWNCWKTGPKGCFHMVYDGMYIYIGCVRFHPKPCEFELVFGCGPWMSRAVDILLMFLTDPDMDHLKAIATKHSALVGLLDLYFPNRWYPKPSKFESCHHPFWEWVNSLSCAGRITNRYLYRFSWEPWECCFLTVDTTLNIRGDVSCLGQCLVHAVGVLIQSGTWKQTRNVAQVLLMDVASLKTITKKNSEPGRTQVFKTPRIIWL